MTKLATIAALFGAIILALVGTTPATAAPPNPGNVHTYEISSDGPLTDSFVIVNESDAPVGVTVYYVPTTGATLTQTATAAAGNYTTVSFPSSGTTGTLYVREGYGADNKGRALDRVDFN